MGTILRMNATAVGADGALRNGQPQAMAAATAVAGIADANERLENSRQHVVLDPRATIFDAYDECIAGPASAASETVTSVPVSV